MTSVEKPVVPNIHPSLPHTNGYVRSTLDDVSAVKDRVSNGIKSAPVTEHQQEESPTKPKFELEEHPVDEFRDIKVGVLGAGLAGITAGVLLPAKLPGLDLRIYDKNADVVCFLITFTIECSPYLTRYSI